MISEAISSCVLNSSGSWSLHTNSINVIFFDGLNCLVLRVASSLDAFRAYPSVRSCPACFITTGTPEAPEYRSSRTRYSFHSDNNAPSRYHTNCLAYLRNLRFLEVQLPFKEIKLRPCLFICMEWTIPSSFPYRRRPACYLFFKRTSLDFSELTIPIFLTFAR